MIQYDYTLRNLGDPAADAGFDFYDVTIFFSSTVDYDSGSAPPEWDIIGGSRFVNTFSTMPGTPPAGTNRGPGQSLGGFRFALTAPIGNASFAALFTNPDDPSRPVSYKGNASAAPGVVPEPGALMLLTSAGWWLARSAYRA